MLPARNPLRFVLPLLLLAAALFTLTYLFRSYHDQSAKWDGIIPEPDDLLASELNTIAIFQQASPSVVFVYNIQKQVNVFTRDVSEVQRGAGSGFIWDRSGHIVTNFHVVQGASRIAVTLIDGKTYEAEKVGEEPSKDLALLKIDLLDTNIVPLGEHVADSSEVLVGQKSIAIGNPYGLDHTLTEGSISALGRSTASILQGITIRDMIQTDAAINPGNSGGPLLDSHGRLIGMNTSILRNSTGIGFAVPSNTIARIVEQIIEFGQPVRSGIGITVDSIATRRMRLGVMIDTVNPGSPAEAAGLRGVQVDAMGRRLAGDIIISIDDDTIKNVDDLYHALDRKRAGDTVRVGYFRSGENLSVEVELVQLSD